MSAVMRAAACELVLFDLDGTLVDSAPDLAGAANDLRAAHGLPPLPYEHLRPLVGTGARGMVGAAFGKGPGDEGFEVLRDAFLSRYESRLLQLTDVFADVRPMLEALTERGRRWGIVTNKATRYTQPIVAGLAALAPAEVVISGDTLPRAKPHPDPLLEAARRAGIAPERCIYVGDDLRDVQAGRAAGMATLVAAWGYLGDASQVGEIHEWQADAVLHQPGALLKWLGMP